MSYTPWRTPCLTLPWKLGWVSFVDRQTSGVRMNRESWRGARGALWQHSDSLLAEQWCVHLSPAHQSLAQKLSRQWKGCRQDKTFMFNCLGRFRNNSPFSFVKLISWKRMFSAHKQEALFCFCCFLFFFKQLGNDLNLIHLSTCPSRMLERHQSWGWASAFSNLQTIAMKDSFLQCCSWTFIPKWSVMAASGWIPKDSGKGATLKLSAQPPVLSPASGTHAVPWLMVSVSSPCQPANTVWPSVCPPQQPLCFTLWVT